MLNPRIYTQHETKNLSSCKFSVESRTTFSHKTPTSDHGSLASLFDGKSESQFRTGSYKEKDGTWISLNWDIPVSVSSVRLQVSQDPAGFTRHKLLLRSDSTTGTDYREVHVWEGDSRNEEWLEHTFDHPEKCTSMRVMSTDSPSLVAWRQWVVMGTLEEEATCANGE